MCVSVVQGALYCLLSVHSGACPAIMRDWDCVGEVWPALVRCGLSPSMTLEKPSIGQLLDDITDRIHRQHDTIGIYFAVSNVSINSQCTALCFVNCILLHFVLFHLQVSERCVEIASQITQSENLESLSSEELKEGLQRQRVRNVVNAR